jgi:Do/DeqQ family serine protease
MKTFWKKTLTVVIVVLISFVTSMWAVSYLVKNNKNVRYALISDEALPFKQPVSLAGFSSETSESIDFTFAAEQAIHAVVHIRSVQRAQASRRGGGDNSQDFDLFEYFFGYRGQTPRQQQPRTGFGSGVIISTDGYIITNNHVIERADEIEVSLNDNRTFTAKVIGTDPNTDIALLKIEANDLQALPFGDSEKLRIGEWVLAVGNPFNLKSTVTAGIVSAKGRSEMRGETDLERISAYIQTDAAVNPGNSGGALVNTMGELVGINTALYSETGNFAGYSFAVPISIAGKVVADLKEYGVVQRAILGIIMLNPQDAKKKDEKVKVLEGAYISDFVSNSSAKAAGLEVGDVITAVNGITIKSMGALQEQINKYRPGDKVKLDVDRYGTAKNFTVELRNAQGNTDIVEKTKNSAEVLGADFQALTDARKKELNISYGIEVNAVDRNGKISDAGIRRGFVIMTVNNQRVTTPDDLNKIVKEISDSISEEKWLLIRGFYPNDRNQREQRYAIDLVD